MIRLAVFLIAALAIAVGNIGDGDDKATFTPTVEKEIIAKVKKSYDSKMSDLLAKIEKAEVLLTNPKTKAAGELTITSSKKQIEKLKDDPLAVLAERLGRNSEPGDFAELPNEKAVVVSSDENGTLVEIAYKETPRGKVNRTEGIGGGQIVATRTVVSSFLLKPPIKNVKQKAIIAQPGLWLVEGAEVIGGDRVQVLHRVEFKREDVTKKK